MATIIYEKDVKDDLECPICKNRFEIPKNLPCGHLICNLCEIKILNKTFYCKICNQEHFVPEKGLPINHFLRKFLINSTFKEINSEAYINTMKCFDRAKSSFQKLKENVKNKETVVKERCELIRNNIDIKAESIINRIQEYRQDLLQQIDKQEKKFLRKNEFEEYLTEFENKYENWALRINENNLSDVKAKVIIEEIMEMEMKFDFVKKTFDEEMANINDLSYEEGKDEPKLDLIGYLSLDSLVLNKLERLKFQQKEKSFNLPKSESESLRQIQCIGKDKLCYLQIFRTCHDFGNHIEIKYQLYSLDCHLLKKKNQKLHNDFDEVRLMLTTFHSNSLVVFLKFSSGSGFIFIFDIDFEVMKSTSISSANYHSHSSLLKLFSCNENIYLCLQNNLDLCIFKYDINLNLKERVNLKDHKFTNIVALKFNQIFTIQSDNPRQQNPVYLNVYDMNNLNLINKHQFSSISPICFKVLAKEIFIFFENNEFCLLNLKTKSLSKFRLNNLNLNFDSYYCIEDSFFVSEDGHLIIHDQKLNVIHIIKSW
jgi:hypothetical protein